MGTEQWLKENNNSSFNNCYFNYQLLISLTDKTPNRRVILEKPDAINNLGHIKVLWGTAGKWNYSKWSFQIMELLLQRHAHAVNVYTVKEHKRKPDILFKFRALWRHLSIFTSFWKIHYFLTINHIWHL